MTSARTRAFASAKSFALLGGVYTAASCYVKRLRQKDDDVTKLMAGCATGLASGWAMGPAVRRSLGSSGA